MAIGKASIEVRADTKKISSDFKKIQTKTKSFVSGVKNRLKEINLSGLNISFSKLALTLTGLTYTVKKMGDVFAQQQKAERQLDAVLKSTKMAAGLTAKELKSLASALQQTTTFGDEATIEMESLLLTFTDIKGEVFKETIPVILDLSTAMKQDLKTSAIQVGKALNDPITGLGALSRVGIQFTAEQKAMVRKFVETNQKAKAQKIILQELTRQFGGSAQAMKNTWSGAVQSMENAWGDMIENLFSKMAPALTRAMNQFTDVLNKVIKDGVKQVAFDAIDDIKEIITNGLTFIVKRYQEKFIEIKYIIKEFGVDFDLAIQKLKINFVKFLDKIWEKAKNIFNKIKNYIKEVFQKAIVGVLKGAIKPLFDGLEKYMKYAPNAIKKRFDAIKNGVNETIKKIESIKEPAKKATNETTIVADVTEEVSRKAKLDKLRLEAEKRKELSKLANEELRIAKETESKKAEIKKDLGIKEAKKTEQAKQAMVAKPTITTKKTTEAVAKEETIAVNKQIRSVFDNIKDRTIEVGRLVEDLANNIKSGFADTFDEFLKFNKDFVSNLKGLFGGLLQSIGSAIRRMIAEILAEKALKTTFGYIGGLLGFASGGIATKPQVATIAENGKERVLTNRQTMAFEKMVNSNFQMNGQKDIKISIKNESGSNLAVKQAYTTDNFREMVVNIVLNEKATNPNFANAIKS